MPFSAAESAELEITNVVVDESTLRVDLNDGRSLSVPLDWYPRLLHGTQPEREDWILIGRGRGVHWEALDEDISIAALLDGKPSAESSASLRSWMRRRAVRPR